MAVTVFPQLTSAGAEGWADTTEQAVFAGACSVKAIIISANENQSAAAYFQLFDAAVGGGVTPGVTVPDWSFKINTKALCGQGLHKFIFPGAGIKFNTACTAFLATAAGGGTAPLTTVRPNWIEVYYERGV